MASSLRLIASNLVTRSFRPTAVSGSCFLSIDDGHRSYSTTPKDDCNGQSVLTIMSPKISSMSVKMSMTDAKRELKVDIPDVGLSVRLDKPGLNIKDMIRAGAGQNTMLFQGINQSPDKTSNYIKEDGMLKVTLPNEDELKNTSIILNNLANNIITSFLDITASRSWSYYDMFSDRSILGKGLCRLIAMRSPINSFTIHKRETVGCLDIEMSIPGDEEMKLTTQGLRVSSRLGYKYEDRHLERDNATVFFDYDTFFIEGKTVRNHHITCIHLPEVINMKHNMIKREIIGDLCYAFLPCCGKMDELHDLLKLTN